MIANSVRNSSKILAYYFSWVCLPWLFTMWSALLYPLSLGAKVLRLLLHQSVHLLLRLLRLLRPLLLPLVVRILSMLVLMLILSRALKAVL